MEKENRRAVCPVCENILEENARFCPTCGWSVLDDVTMNGVLFEEAQVEEYEKRLKIYREVYRKGALAAPFVWGRKASSVKPVDRPKHPNPPIPSKHPNPLYQPYKPSRWYAAILEKNSWVPISEMSLCPANKMKKESFGHPDHWFEEYYTEAEQEEHRKLQADVHNQGVGVCKNLSSVYSLGEILEQIKNGYFENLYVGDYFDMEIDGLGKTRFVLAGFNCLDGEWKDGNDENQKNHAVVVPAAALRKLSKSLEEDDDGYAYDAVEAVLQEYEEIFQRAFDGHILRRTEKTVGAGGKGGGKTFGDGSEPALKLMDEKHLTGIMGASAQFPLFREYPTAKRVSKTYPLVGSCGKAQSSDGYWLTDEKLPTRFGMISRGGKTECDFKEGKHGLRPYFCIG